MVLLLRFAHLYLVFLYSLFCCRLRLGNRYPITLNECLVPFTRIHLLNWTKASHWIVHTSFFIEHHIFILNFKHFLSWCDKKFGGCFFYRWILQLIIDLYNLVDLSTRWLLVPHVGCFYRSSIFNWLFGELSTLEESLLSNVTPLTVWITGVFPIVLNLTLELRNLFPRSWGHLWSLRKLSVVNTLNFSIMLLTL